MRMLDSFEWLDLYHHDHCCSERPSGPVDHAAAARPPEGGRTVVLMPPHGRPKRPRSCVDAAARPSEGSRAVVLMPPHGRRRITRDAVHCVLAPI